VWPTVWLRPDWLMPVIQRQSTDTAKSITSANVSAAGTLMLLIKMPAMVTFYRGHLWTLCCLTGIISLIITCIGIIFTQVLLRRQTRHTGLWLGLNSGARHTVHVTLYCTWRPSGLATGLHGQGNSTQLKINKYRMSQKLAVDNCE